jgi:hypothetical protein
LRWIAAEMNDPYTIPPVPDNLDPFTRARIWDKWGFGVLQFPYVQPALAADRRPVRGLLLIAKLLDPAWHGAVAAADVDLLVQEYLRWAMRIETPSANAEYGAMSAWLEARRLVGWQTLRRFIGEDAPRPFAVIELRAARAPEFTGAIDVYRRAFSSPATSVAPSALARGLERYRESGYAYHLWALQDVLSDTTAGIASFFSFDAMGFGGYVALEGGLRSAGCLRPVVARIEQQMRLDPRSVRGWLIETEAEGTRSIFERCGFYALALDYRQPPLPGAESEATPALQLMYKPLGQVYSQPSLSTNELLAALAQILRYVYRIDDPHTHATYLAVKAQVKPGVRFL